MAPKPVLNFNEENYTSWDFGVQYFETPSKIKKLGFPIIGNLFTQHIKNWVVLGFPMFSILGATLGPPIIGSWTASAPGLHSDSDTMRYKNDTTRYDTIRYDMVYYIVI